RWLIVLVAIYGVGESVCNGVSQIYAMDLAPENRRGAFLGVWSFLVEAGTAAAPLVVGFTAERFGYGFTFVSVGAALAVVAVIMGLYGSDTGRRAQPARVLAASDAT